MVVLLLFVNFIEVYIEKKIVDLYFYFIVEIWEMILSKKY